MIDPCGWIINSQTTMSLPKQTLALHFKCCCHRHYNYPQVCHRQKKLTRTYPHQLSCCLQMSCCSCGWRAVGKLAHLSLGSPLYTWHATLLPTQTLAEESPIWAETHAGCAKWNERKYDWMQVYICNHDSWSNADTYQYAQSHRMPLRFFKMYKQAHRMGKQSKL